jgi:hypothetical protein
MVGFFNVQNRAAALGSFARGFRVLAPPARAGAIKMRRVNNALRKL